MSERYEILVEVAGGEARCSLARLLKALGRRYNVRCLAVRPAGTPAAAPAVARGEPSGEKPATEAEAADVLSEGACRWPTR